MLYEQLDTLSKFGMISKEIPKTITTNLNPKFGVRPYQAEAFARFIFFQNNPFQGKPNPPYHLLFNMATGSGKTLMMAGLILYLYEKGHRNFLFFVNSSNIIQKTRDNFMNGFSGKYLFNKTIIFNSRAVFLKEVQNFENADNENINICFTTIQQLHSDLNSTKENSLTFEDFTDKKTVLIADEAHHLNTSTKNTGSLYGTWEDTVIEILNKNQENLLLEFTATMDFESKEILQKYTDKVIFKYDLAQFRKDKYSKEIDLIRSYYDEKERIIQALIINQYRQELASSYNINLKPVILFKAKRTVAESELNKENFHKLIENLVTEQVQKVLQESTVDIVQKAKKYFEEKHISMSSLMGRIQSNFKYENCISANNDSEAEKNQLILNSLEENGNPVRAVFAVQKLNEGWDVLNLFDIVRLYEDRDGKNGKPGKTTISEAQLIGRGARYFPFSIVEGEDKFTRKYDNDVSHDLKVLEELYYHTKEDSNYISEIKKALVDSGIYEDDKDLENRDLKLKESFKQTDFYKTGVVFSNRKVIANYSRIKSMADLGVKQKDSIFTLSSGIGKRTSIDDILEVQTDVIGNKSVKLSNFPYHVVRYALSTNRFYDFDRLLRFFPNLKSSSEFIKSRDYLGYLEVIFKGTEVRRNELNNLDYLGASQKLLNEIEEELRTVITEYAGTEIFTPKPIRDVFKDKPLRINKNDERIKGQEELLFDKDWYVFNANYGTTEEKEFVKMFAARFEQWNQHLENIYLIRNERVVKIHDSKGRTFEPDFILFAKQKTGDNYTLQVFIEPKGKHLMKEDEWKEDFLKILRAKKQTIVLNADSYQITAVPFYNTSIENDFRKEMDLLLSY